MTISDNLTPRERQVRETLAGVRKHSPATCERNLKRMPGYSPSLGVPAIFVCECGRRWQFVDDEAEGASWVLA